MRVIYKLCEWLYREMEQTGEFCITLIGGCAHVRAYLPHISNFIKLFNFYFMHYPQVFSLILHYPMSPLCDWLFLKQADPAHTSTARRFLLCVHLNPPFPFP
jgi:hypothetical protein